MTTHTTWMEVEGQAAGVDGLAPEKVRSRHVTSQIEKELKLQMIYTLPTYVHSKPSSTKLLDVLFCSSIEALTSPKTKVTSMKFYL